MLLSNDSLLSLTYYKTSNQNGNEGVRSQKTALAPGTYEPKTGRNRTFSHPACGNNLRFMYALATKPAGILAWGFIATLLFPVTLLMYGEAGRYGAKGLVRWPILATWRSNQIEEV